MKRLIIFHRFRKLLPGVFTLPALWVLLAALPLQAQFTVKQLQAYVPTEEAQFGQSVSISDNLAIVGATGEGSGGAYSGAAYIFERDVSGAWTQRRFMKANAPEAYGMFGWSVGISGNWAIVSTTTRVTHGIGTVYFFEWEVSGAWGEEARHKFQSGAKDDQFGCSVAIYDKWAIVGASDEGSDDEADDYCAGAAYIFERDDTGVWQQPQRILADDRAKYDNFGSSVAISGDWAIVGASNEGHGGAVYFFERVVDGDNTSWLQRQKIQPNGLQNNDDFGCAVAISGVRAIVGASGTSDGGAAYIFEQAGGVWSEQQKLPRSSAVGNGARFGRSVGISGDLAIVGNNNDGIGAGTANYVGEAYLYRWDGSAWQLKPEALAREGGTQQDGFGISVGLSGNRAIVGALGHESGGRASSGAAYIFEAPASPTPPGPVLSLRHLPNQNLSSAEVTAMLAKNGFYDEYRNSSGKGIQHDYREQTLAGKKVVSDGATGLIWQQSGSSKDMTYDQASAYIAQLNRDRFAGFDDWRLPTLEEAMSLMGPVKANGLYIDMVFDARQLSIWTSDQPRASAAWGVNFSYAYCTDPHFGSNFYVRAVRFGQ